jgi:histidinol-phosphate aminotransferase
VRELETPNPREYAELGRELVRMDLNEAAFHPDASEMALFQRELAQLDLNRYPEASGRALRERLARRWHVEADEILLGNGSVETIGMLMTTFGAPRQGVPATVIHADPTYGQYDIMASGYGLRAVPVPLGLSFELDEERVAAAIDRERPALAFYACPNSPTGNCFPHDSLERLARRMDGVFVVDEAYADFAGDSIMPRIHATPGLFVMRSLSKIGLAGLRVGALIGERDAIAELDKVRMPYNVNAVSLAFATSVLTQPERMEARIASIIRLRRALEFELRAIEGVDVLPSQANFLLIRTPYAAELVFERLLARGIVVRVFPQVARLARCLRITAGTPLENARCVRALRDALTALGRDRPPAALAAHGA